MRGAQSSASGMLKYGRIIPADAGSTETRVWAFPASKDHPRGCGEHAIGFELLFPVLGSSPRMRGAQKGQA